MCLNVEDTRGRRTAIARALSLSLEARTEREGSRPDTCDLFFFFMFWNEGEGSA